MAAQTKMKVSAAWYVEPASPGVAIRMRGDGPGNLDFPETTISNSGTITDAECSNPFINEATSVAEVDFFDPMAIKWEFLLDGDPVWHPSGTSMNQTYVTYDAPKTTVYHTLAHLGCKNADGKSTPEDCTADIWKEFTDRVVKRVDGTQLTYYASYMCSNNTTAQLLASGDGQCGAWAAIFLDMRKVQGIDDTDEYVKIEAINDHGFIVKDWTFNGTGASGDSTWPYLNIQGTPFITATCYNWQFEEASDVAGIAGQGNSNPASMFNNHQVFIGGHYYDPSYGREFSSLQDIDDNVIDGFFHGPIIRAVDEPLVNHDLNGNGNKTDMGVPTKVILFRKNPAGLNIKETRLNY